MRKLFLAAGFLAGVTAFAQAPDNSNTNKLDDTEHAMTPEKQSNSKADLDLARKIRREVTMTDTFSTYAKNVKIVTRDGVAHLRGPVKNAEEKQAIEAIAKKLAGDAKVMSHLEIAPAK